MYFLKKLNIALIILFTFITFSQAETSWITKKKDKDKTEKTTKVVEKKSSEWIKKKEVKDNKKKLKEKLKDSKSWITKKSKDKVKDIKNKLKKHKTIDNLPKAEFYFAAKIEPLDDEDPQYIYGYVNSNKKSDTFIFKDQSYYSKSDGIAYFENKKNRCQVDVKITPKSYSLSGDVVLECRKNKKMAGGFTQMGSVGEGIGEHWNGNSVKFLFYTKKIDAIAKLENLKSTETQFVERQLPTKKRKKILLKPNGKYYALLIGNSKYSNGWDNLVSPINDIRLIKSAFEEYYSFEKILTVENGTKKDIYKAFSELSKITTTNDFVLIYYSGHGQIKSEQAYWIPVNGSTDWSSGDWVNISEIDIFLTDMKAHHLTVLVDSCFVGSKFKGLNLIDDIVINNEENYEKFLESAINLRSRSVLSSGTSGQVSDTVKGTNNSRFALSIVNSLQVYNKRSYPLDLDQLSQLMKVSYTGFQKPMYYHPDSWKHGGGTFTFIPKKNLK